MAVTGAPEESPRSLFFTINFSKKLDAWPRSPRVRSATIAEFVQKKERAGGRILCAGLTSVSPVTHTASVGPDGCPSLRPMRQGSPSRVRGGGSLPGTGGCPVPSQAASRQANRHAARAAVPIMTNAHGFHAFWQLSGSKAYGRRGGRRDAAAGARRADVTAPQ